MEELGEGGWRVLMELDLYVIRNEMRQICSSPVLQRGVINTHTLVHIYTVYQGKPALSAGGII